MVPWDYDHLLNNYIASMLKNITADDHFLVRVVNIFYDISVYTYSITHIKPFLIPLSYHVNYQMLIFSKLFKWGKHSNLLCNSTSIATYDIQGSKASFYNILQVNKFQKVLSE